MKKDNILYGIIGVLVGFIVGFAFANTTNQRGYAAQSTTAGQPQQTAGLPPDHPPIDGASAGPNAAAVGAAMKLASEQPGNFDAQVKAAEVAYAAHRYDDAIKIFTLANQLRPEQFDVLVGLGNTNFDAERFEEAEKWYIAALRQQPDNVNVRTDLGLTFFFREPRDVERAVKEYRASLERDPAHIPTLQNLTVALTAKGDADAARAALSKLESLSPQNPALPRLRADLEKLKMPGRTAANTSPAEEGGK
ncbi:MAG TPA: tetratricopeptide repeat protein [Pyrinomonadaceae bacterium]